VKKPEDWPWSSFNHWATGDAGRVEIESHWTWTRRERAGTPPSHISGAPFMTASSSWVGSVATQPP
jgi:hypothetical protein